MRTWAPLIAGFGLAVAIAGASFAAGPQTDGPVAAPPSPGATPVKSAPDSNAPPGEDAEARRRRLANEEAVARAQAMHGANRTSSTSAAGFADESAQLPRDFAHCAMRNGNLVCGSALEAMDAVASHLGQ